MTIRALVLAILIFATGLLMADITLTYPNGGEVWTPGNSYSINWNSSGVTGNVKIELYRFIGMGVLEETITSSYSVSSGSYNWYLPLTVSAGSNFYVMITSLSNPNDYDMSDNFFTITPPPTINVTSPNGGEVWTAGNTYPITWTSTNLVGFVMIRLLIGTAGNYTTINSSVNSSVGSFNWPIPTTIASGTNFKISIISISNYTIADTSDSYFTINSAPGIYVTSPNGGEHWFRGSTYPVQWNAVNMTGNAKIELFRGTNTTPTATIVSSTIVNSGIQMWIIPTTIPEANDYKVKITSITNPSVYDYSNNYFTITDFVGNDDPQVTPLVTAVQSIYPNPFRTDTTIKYSVKDAGNLTLGIYDVKGRLVKHLLHSKSSAGSFSTTWNGTDESGNQLPNGVYYLQMKTESCQTTRKIVLLR